MRTKGILAIWHDIEPGHEDAVLEWYNREHHIERVSIPGFVRARRHSAIAGEPALFIYYETQSPQVLGSESYLARVNAPTEWTRHCMPHFRANSRTVCHASVALQGAEGGYALTLRMRPEAGREHDLRNYVGEELFPSLRAEPLFLRAELWEAVHDITTIRSTERVIRGAEDRVEAWTLVVWASDSKTIARLATRLSDQRDLSEAGAHPDMQCGQYQLDMVLEREFIPQ
ncbi:hypothetical protein EV667_3235 [Ancylobacter aquaticus]|uniref:Uncharacterized protein n=1 Tax=Ancylobacter aquaticus TaxID=100 RepID=A0A4R1I5C1_ANCAQ|nr:hypothetical protein EV667_3235 [Ancylobacter aquaticus]